MSTIKAVCRRGVFSHWTKVTEGLPEIHVPMPDNASYLDPREARRSPAMPTKLTVWVFRMNNYLREDLVEYIYDREEIR